MFQDTRVNPDKNWPFMYSLRDGQWYSTAQEPTPMPPPTPGEMEEEVGTAKW